MGCVVTSEQELSWTCQLYALRMCLNSLSFSFPVSYAENNGLERAHEELHVKSCTQVCDVARS